MLFWSTHIFKNKINYKWGRGGAPRSRSDLQDEPIFEVSKRLKLSKIEKRVEILELRHEKLLGELWDLKNEEEKREEIREIWKRIGTYAGYGILVFLSLLGLGTLFT